MPFNSDKLRCNEWKGNGAAIDDNMYCLQWRLSGQCMDGSGETNRNMGKAAVAHGSLLIHLFNPTLFCRGNHPNNVISLVPEHSIWYYMWWEACRWVGPSPKYPDPGLCKKTGESGASFLSWHLGSDLLFMSTQIGWFACIWSPLFLQPSLFLNLKHLYPTSATPSCTRWTGHQLMIGMHHRGQDNDTPVRK